VSATARVWPRKACVVPRRHAAFGDPTLSV